MAEKALGFFPGHPALVQLKERCKDSGISVSMEAMQPSMEVTGGRHEGGRRDR